MAKRYTVSDGKLMLIIEPVEDGWFMVTSPLDPAMITQARNVPDAFEMARDAFAALEASRADPDRWKKAECRLKAARRKSGQRKVGAGI